MFWSSGIGAFFSKCGMKRGMSFNSLIGIEYERFVQNEVIKRAVAMTRANIGEFCNALSDDVKLQYKDIPWAAIRKTRNVISHDYEALDARKKKGIDGLRDALIPCSPICLGMRIAINGMDFLR